MRGHRGLAVGREPGDAEPAILTRPQPDRALARLLEHEGLVFDMALAPGPGRGMLVVDAWADRVDGGQIVAARRFDAEQDFPAVGVKPVPGIPEAVRRLRRVTAHPRPVRRR